ncbi:MAG: site-specific integrase [Pseudomonadota bacterium]
MIRVAKGVSIRESKRILADGSPDCSFVIFYRYHNQDYSETVGWRSSGMTLEKAIAIRELRVKGIDITEKTPKEQRVKKTSYASPRHKTDHTGVFYRYAQKRLKSNGERDKCYEILTYTTDKDMYELVGWESEGYTLEDAVKLRMLRTKATRHIELVGLTFDQLWDYYQKNWLPNLKRPENTTLVYKAHIQPKFGELYISTITQVSVESFKQKLLLKLQPSTVQDILRTMKKIINKGKSWRLLDPNFENPVEGVIVYGHDKRRERFLSFEEGKNLLLELQFTSCELYYISKISLYSGMRIGEILALTASDIDIDNKTIFIQNGKTGDRFAFMANQLVEDFKILLKEKTPESLLFSKEDGQSFTVRYISKLFFRTINLLRINDGITDTSKKVVFHTFRHTFCSWLAIKGVPIHTIAALAGHKTIKMTQRYAKLSPDAKHDALKLLP